MSGAGIDYGMGQSNIDHATGIRYGVIAQHGVGQAWYDDAQPEYGKAHCPKCSIEASEYSEDSHGEYTAYSNHSIADYACESCEQYFSSEYAFPDEPIGFTYSAEGYELTDCLNVNIFVLKSPYYTFAQFCSPCVPGAGDLDNAMPDGVKTYCLGHEWFWEHDGKAPYPVYSVATGQLIEAIK